MKEMFVSLILTVFGLGFKGIRADYPTDPPATRAPQDKLFLDFDPEYVALLGMGIAFFLLFITVIVIICMTAKARRGK
jgi:hypothetical protein